MNTLFRLKEWFIYHLFADTVYNIHSPFVFEFWQNVIQPARKDMLYQTHILPILRQLYANKSQLAKHDLGTGKNSGTETVARVAKTSSIVPKYGHILHQIVRYFKPQIMIELGTCFGISTRYLCHDFTGTHFYSIEGSPQRLQIAQSCLSDFDSTKLILIQGSFENVLPQILEKHSYIDLVFVDGNHTFEATQKYFTLILPHVHAGTLLIFDDIHWSKGMCRAWKYIYTHPKVTLSIDLFQIGICFFNSRLAKQNIILHY
ncbi:MAG: class I SAM-dependent methyltransferase [Bacteroidia bacterium]|nr:class I SAM-dependent methyltransferase [Bacteroidia bacterium]MDW8301979.1 class I SAM-dependent methyltransferase [Bacteroidia bacterium]